MHAVSATVLISLHHPGLADGDDARRAAKARIEAVNRAVTEMLRADGFEIKTEITYLTWAAKVVDS